MDLKNCIQALFLSLVFSAAAQADVLTFTCAWVEQYNSVINEVEYRSAPNFCMKPGGVPMGYDDLVSRVEKAEPPTCPEGFKDLGKQMISVSMDSISVSLKERTGRITSSERIAYVVARQCLR